LALALPALAQEAGQLSGANAALPLVHVENGLNSVAAQKAHYVVLVSLDGFRWDFAKHDGATHLLALGKQGVWAPEGMMPSYPSLTFPNHFSIVTGLYPEHHGLVANNFYDEAKQARFAISDAKAVTDGSWYSGREPGHADGLSFLAGVRSRNRRTSPHLVRGLRCEDPSER
jgi:alkaline phosphatase D